MPQPREELPRVFELLNCAGQAQRGDFFFDFETSVGNIRGKKQAFDKLEALLQLLDDAAWQDLKPRALRELRKRRPGRGWQSLFDVFNEAKGFAHLKEIGAAHIRFIPRTSAKTPDLEAVLNGQRLLCEVKTINISDDQAAHRRRVYEQGKLEVTKVSFLISDQMLAKASATLASARNQLESFDAAGGARRIIFLVISFDDWVGDYQPQYLAQLDEHFGAQPMADVELVVSPASNLFLRTFTMKSATVWEPPA